MTLKSFILCTALGGLILFFWQFLSFAGLNLHEPAQRHTPLSPIILEHLEGLDLEPGMYALGSPSPEERADPQGLGAEYQARMEGQPYAVLNYQLNWTNNMLPNLGRSLAMNWMTAALLFFLLGQTPSSGLGRRVALACAVGFVGFCFFPYSNFIWFKNPDIWAHLADAVVPFALLGALHVKVV